MSSPSAPTDPQPSEVARFEEVCRLGQDWREQIATTVALAFAEDPVWQWLVGIDRTLTLDEALPLARGLVARSSAADEIHGFRDHRAIALWSAPAGQVTEEIAAASEAQAEPFWTAIAEQVGGGMERLGALAETMRANHPDEPHWYLSIVGVRPGLQGQGLGTRVLAPMLDRCDRLGIATYLESSNPRNHSLYHRLGYDDLGDITVLDSPPLRRFLRGPK